MTQFYFNADKSQFLFSTFEKFLKEKNNKWRITWYAELLDGIQHDELSDI